ncbi:hypothetical protein QR680_016883 [Steinernema hermaphroditum]|uniref:7TM GPCR serpentine receptor class x (Srx) domain-containing protein n=1 Tax=Steinernema hermaphroditum TaxID=289476 RepID=A0AA39LNA0_9BILA|nr:hypothetical protein QR680_016883 [Steinernema hermaphroditum]
MEALNATFVFGDEVRGRGYVTRTDLIVGSVLFWLSATAVILGVLNLVAIKKLRIFHNPFGQPKEIPVELGIAAFTVGYFFAHEACVMHQIVSLNRCVAVCVPLKYQAIYTKRTCCVLIAFVWIEVFIIGAAYHAVPCNLLGYSPQLYEFTFVKCSSTVGRDYSLVGTVVNRLCFSICAATVCFDVITLWKIFRIHMSKEAKSKDFRREIRFCVQSSVQNVTMMTALTWIVWINNAKAEETFKTVLTLDALIFTHITNALVLILLNPEVRSRFLQLLLCRKDTRINCTTHVSTHHKQPNSSSVA